MIRTRARRMLGADKTTELWRLIQHFIGESTLFKFCVLIWAKPGLFCFHFRPFLITMTNMAQQTLNGNAQMVCLGFEHGTAGCKAQPNPLSYRGILQTLFYHKLNSGRKSR